ncbi:NADPH-dependent oxidoreductase [Streptomyces sp. SDr-06]|uniref:NADPH-dependent FMN reductase n=1 Tax=Streptomyces sp. SDr-06 TaxID=2267702 RepID=UPI000DE8AF32|nr:NAD(P)H-dependent oxidoreductase [Streptomyces sp. SDr-06]RCH64010.1 NADPH-dependent oxidoreductase [Streptomyces sp. SDr-06]
MSRLLVLSTSTRTVSNGRAFARWVADAAGGHEAFDVEFTDLGELALPLLDEPEYASTGIYTHQHTRDWSAIAGAADAFVFVMPMYNGGFTAPLKNALDHLYQEWQGKPVGLVSYSAGDSGGAPAAEMLLPVLARLGLRPAQRRLAVPAIHSLVSEGAFAPSEGLDGELAVLLDELAKLTLDENLA